MMMLMIRDDDDSDENDDDDDDDDGDGQVHSSWLLNDNDIVSNALSWFVLFGRFSSSLTQLVCG